MAILCLQPPSSTDPWDPNDIIGGSVHGPRNGDRVPLGAWVKMRMELMLSQIQLSILRACGCCLAARGIRLSHRLMHATPGSNFTMYTVGVNITLRGDGHL